MIDLTGKRFGKLVVLSRAENRVLKSGRSVPEWNCKCDCGKFVKVRGDMLRTGNTKSCGCYKKEESSQRLTIDLTGKRFGRLTVVSRNGSKNNSATWNCKCDCGNDCVITHRELVSGDTKSCGCIRKERNNNTRHGKRYTKMYKVWLGIKQRCNDVNCKAYRYYGKLGVIICNEWSNDFMNFYNWAMANGYKEGLSIDRINPFGNYEPSNCRWIPSSEQAKNKRNSKCNERYKKEFEKNLDKFN